MTQSQKLKFIKKGPSFVTAGVIAGGYRLQKKYSFSTYNGPEGALNEAHKDVSEFLRRHNRPELPPLSEYADRFGIGPERPASRIPASEDVPQPGARERKRGGTIVRWSDHEKELIAKQVAALRLSHFRETIVDLVNLAQREVLPQDRQRPIKTMAVLGDGLIALIRAAILAKAEKLDAPEPVGAPAAAVEIAQPVPPVPEVITIEVENKDPERVFRAATTGELLGRGIDKLLSDLSSTGFNASQSLASALLGALGKVSHIPAPPAQIIVPEPAKPRRARVLVVGLLNGQVQEVSQKIEKLPVNVSFYEADATGRDFPPSVEFVVMTKFISHAWWEKAKAALPPDRVFFVQGTTGVVQKMFDIASRQPASS